MSVVDSRFITLSDVAAVIWQAADGKTPLSEIVSKQICFEFDVDVNRAQRDAQQFVDDLSQQGVLLVSARPIDCSIAAEVP